MKYGFVKAAAVTPAVSPARVEENYTRITGAVKDAVSKGAKIIVLPELCVTGSTCGDLFLDDLLQDRALEAVLSTAAYTSPYDALICVGFPFAYQGALYNAAAVLKNGEILGIVPKVKLTAEESRYFAPGDRLPEKVVIAGKAVPAGAGLVFACREMKELSVSVLIGRAGLSGITPESFPATAAVCMDTGSFHAGRPVTAKEKSRLWSFEHGCGLIWTTASVGESTTDMVFGSENIIAENGEILAASKPFYDETAISEIDFETLYGKINRRAPLPEGKTVWFGLSQEKTKLSRKIAASPFIPKDAADRKRYCEEILDLQSLALSRRMTHIGCRKAVLGISGGLDSTLALLAVVRAFDRMQIPRENILAVTMPGLGTTKRTHDNASVMMKELGVTAKEISIGPAVRLHFADIGHDEHEVNAAYENAQARERTQILMDLANDVGGIVVGTGDASELALGWATYNGDHMSMYGVNGSVPKTVVRLLVRYLAESCETPALKEALLDVVDTPVSPELTPQKGGEISQKTEDLIGPYELHDFFLYHFLIDGWRPKKMLYMAKEAFAGTFDEAVIKKWLTVFYRRFFSQQFKRSCLPDGPQVTQISLSPRGGLVMPSDASADIWLKELK